MIAYEQISRNVLIVVYGKPRPRALVLYRKEPKDLGLESHKWNSFFWYFKLRVR